MTRRRFTVADWEAIDRALAGCRSQGDEKGSGQGLGTAAVTKDERIEAAASKVQADYALCGALRGRPIPIGDAEYRSIARVALAAAGLDELLAETERLRTGLRKAMLMLAIGLHTDAGLAIRALLGDT